MASGITVDISNIDHLLKEIGAEKDIAIKAVNATMKDVKSRAPGWVTAGIREVYNIKAKDINNAKRRPVITSDYTWGGKLQGVEIHYIGGLLTPIHFSMTPKTRPGPTATGKIKKYTVKHQVLKAGGKRVLEGNDKNSNPVFLATTSAGNEGAPQIAFQRVGDSRTTLEAVKRISVAQMVTSERTAEYISENINEGIAKRLEHNIKRFNR